MFENSLRFHHFSANQYLCSRHIFRQCQEGLSFKPVPIGCCGLIRLPFARLSNGEALQMNWEAVPWQKSRVGKPLNNGDFAVRIDLIADGTGLSALHANGV